jgi:hypothetical protein
MTTHNFLRVHRNVWLVLAVLAAVTLGSFCGGGSVQAAADSGLASAAEPADLSGSALLAKATRRHRPTPTPTPTPTPNPTPSPAPSPSPSPSPTPASSPSPTPKPSPTPTPMPSPTPTPAPTPSPSPTPTPTPAPLHSVSISWAGSTSSGLEGYNVYRSSVSGGPYTRVSPTLPSNALTYIDQTTAAGQKYFYVITAVGSTGVESVASNEVTVTAQ